MIVDPIIREIGTRLSARVLGARLLTGQLRTPALEPLNAALVEPTYTGSMRVRETDDAQPRFEKITSHGSHRA